MLIRYSHGPPLWLIALTLVALLGMSVTAYLKSQPESGFKPPSGPEDMRPLMLATSLGYALHVRHS